MPVLVGRKCLRLARSINEEASTIAIDTRFKSARRVAAGSQKQSCVVPINGIDEPEA